MKKQKGQKHYYNQVNRSLSCLFSHNLLHMFVFDLNLWIKSCIYIERVGILIIRFCYTKNSKLLGVAGR